MFDNNLVMTSIFTEFRKELEDSVMTPDISFYANRTDLIKSKQYVTYNHVELNKGNGMNATTGIFTAPRAGTYLFTFHSYGREYQYLEIKLNGMTQTRIQDNGNNASRTSAMSIILFLNINDKVGAYLLDGATSGASYFSGILIRKGK